MMKRLSSEKRLETMTQESGTLQHLRWIDECWQHTSPITQQNPKYKNTKDPLSLMVKSNKKTKEISNIQKGNYTLKYQNTRKHESLNEAIKLTMTIHKLYQRKHETMNETYIRRLCANLSHQRRKCYTQGNAQHKLLWKLDKKSSQKES